jgi:hypothetical protein
LTLGLGGVLEVVAVFLAGAALRAFSVKEFGDSRLYKRRESF